MANINSPDMHGYKLLQQAVNMDIPVILLSVEDNEFLATGALEHGALLYIKKPVTLDILKYLWQHVEREKMSNYKEKERLMGITQANNNMGGIEFRGEVEEENNVVGSNNMKDNKYKGKRKILGRKGSVENEEYEPEHQIIDNKVRKRVCTRRVCTEWTRELHGKFMDAVAQLGDGRCFPKEILKRMNVTGLTRMQVASHLQKCRNDNWRPPEERKYQQNFVPTASSDADSSAQIKLRRFGSMPGQKNNSLLFQEHPKASEGSKIHFEKDIPNDDGHETITMAPIMNSHQQYHESGPSNVRTGSNPSSNPRYPSDGFFNFLEMDYFIHNYSSVQQGSGMDMNQRTSPEAIHDPDQVSPDRQNSAMQNADSGGHWSSETSIFASNSSETGGQET
ncbi:two-component response regulator ARR14-like [Olea europaea var. sylvestris]|uniref:two-component response regulator ARR14-like n=1 Tax=Olea europaea var. sylvestris TaxID=158386 RepID=UPI000C1CE51B|nr:two-component response regulator ARR14-like [Olea europaea var. sylvestris]